MIKTRTCIYVHISDLDLAHFDPNNETSSLYLCFVLYGLPQTEPSQCLCQQHSNNRLSVRDQRASQ